MLHRYPSRHSRIRADETCADANLFKKAFEDAQSSNVSLGVSAPREEEDEEAAASTEKPTKAETAPEPVNVSLSYDLLTSTKCIADFLAGCQCGGREGGPKGGASRVSVSPSSRLLVCRARLPSEYRA